MDETSRVTELVRVLGDLIEVLHEQAMEMERVMTQVEQVTTRLPEVNRYTATASQLAELHVRVRRLASGGNASPMPTSGVEDESRALD